jgi:hypothetical protein
MVTEEKLGPRRRLLIGAFTVALAAAGFAAGRSALRPTEAVAQPIQFNHQKHVKEVELECTTCHEYATTGAHSGLPSLSTCQGCHSEALTKSPEEQKLLELIATDPQPQFKKLFRLPDHAYYSHRRHVVAGALACGTCHGGIADTTAPPRYPLVRITMATCTSCHAEKGVATGCTDCHR